MGPGLSPNVFDLINSTNRMLGLMPLPSGLMAQPKPSLSPFGPALKPGRGLNPSSPAGVIQQNAKRFGLDPAAVLAYALEESNAKWGAVGDQGTSFGPFQAHIGGAAGSRTPAAASAWANSPQGLIQMMGMMSRTPIRGKTGQAAVRAVYQYFGKGTPTAVPKGLARYAQAQRMLANELPYDPNTQQLNVDTSNPNTRTALTTLFGNTPFKVIGLPYQGTHGRAFNARAGSNNWESENAVDFSVPIGTPVYALSDGTIGSQIGSLGTGGRFAGLRLHLIGGGNEWYYAHLSRLAVRAGQKVRKGQLLGYTGEANGVPHLHLASKAGSPPR